ncbi:hypothetical protein FA10DRAFT_270132 [Acaromyces ingoldii]|uniref:CipC-like antibiotic response protein n=1 Tax=Acaromyces ingoldii TaxID=215250 RepID=A0A316YBD1_9BASI|nr:hypothetical protein FA10DRAFT_270132 [Acaromyces ingoldii]PWN86581.1 hypothetical protein FA10DRAFT_270132 [Acaromyces ingoldii]
MGFFSHESHQEVYGGQHEGKFSHELIGGAAAFEAMKAYEDHERREGKPANHSMAKEIFAGLVGAEVDKLAETKGLDYIDREKAKRHAIDEGSQQLEGRY